MININVKDAFWPLTFSTLKGPRGKKKKKKKKKKLFGSVYSIFCTDSKNISQCFQKCTVPL